MAFSKASESVKENEKEFIATMEGLQQLMNEEQLENTTNFIIKGYSFYLHTHQKAKIRKSSDVDILSSDAEKLKRVIIANASEHLGRVSPHELLNARAFGIKFDLHRHYPVWSPEAGTGTIVRAVDRAVMYHFGNISVSKLNIDDLMKGGGALIYRSGATLRRADAAAGVLIHCAHCYRNAVSRSSASIRNVPPVRICELLELSEYLRAPDFDQNRFLQLVQQLGALESVTLTARLLCDYLNDGTLEAILTTANLAVDRSCERLICVWGGFWQRIPWKRKHFFFRHISTDEIVRNYDGNEFLVKNNDQLNFMLNEIAGGGWHPLIHVFESMEKSIPFTVRIIFHAATAEVILKVPVVTEQVNKRICIDLFDQTFEHNWNISCDTSKWKSSRRSDVIAVDFQSGEGHYTLSLTLACNRAVHSSRCAILIAAGEFETDHIMHAGTLLPATILFS